LPKITPTGTDLLKDKHKGNGLPPPLIMPPPLLPGIDAKPQNENKIEIARPPSPNPEIKVPLKIAIMGTAPSSKMLAPFNDPTWQIWSCSPGNQDIPRWDAWFEIHSNLLWPECIAYGAPYVEWLKKQTKPVYMQDSNLVPNATRLPIEDLIKEFGRYFFTSSFTYMIAMAIRAGATDISLFGIDMASKNEYILQRPGGHYFMQKAAERGIKVAVPYESDLAQPPPLYGYSDSTPYGRKVSMREQELNTRINQLETERAKICENITYLRGALEDNDYHKSIWGGVEIQLGNPPQMPPHL
jgi:hypothetical protein